MPVQFVTTLLAATPIGDILVWAGALVAIVIVGGIVIFQLRQYLRSEGSTSTPGFTLQNLRDLHAAGELTDDEYETARTALIAALRPPPKPVESPADDPEPPTPAAPG
ncbi:MAG: SHOCT domain-containing protein [Phycisphaerales bacterium]|nr:SHOCT domain-containing protein [Phycisphaerales bacterium]